MAPRIPNRLAAAVSTLLLLLLTFPPPSHSETESIKLSLLQFMEFLSRGKPITLPNWGWNKTSDPCSWTGVTCDPESRVRAIALEGFNLTGFLKVRGLCGAVGRSLRVLALTHNSIIGPLQSEIANCSNLTHLYLGRNRFEGSVPGSIQLLTNLKRLVISDNSFSGELPGWEVSNRLVTFNVFNNRPVGRIPGGFADFPAFSFGGNPGLCGRPLSVACSPSPAHSPSSLVN